MSDKERRVSERSLENLKLGAESRRQGKLRHNFTILPETVQWLKGTGNASDTVDALVTAARNGGLISNNTHDWKDKQQDISNNTHDWKTEQQDISNDVYNRIKELEAQLEAAKSELKKSRVSEKDVTDQLCQCHTDAFKAADILKAALKLKSNAGGAIKREIEKALPLIDDV